MDFVFGLPQTQRQNDSIWVIMDRLKISANFIRVKSIYTTAGYARININEIVSLHRILLSNISDRGALSVLEIFPKRF